MPGSSPGMTRWGIDRNHTLPSRLWLFAIRSPTSSTISNTFANTITNTIADNNNKNNSNANSKVGFFF